MRTCVLLLLSCCGLLANPLNPALLGAAQRAPVLIWLSSSNVTESPASAWLANVGNISLSQGTATNRPTVTASAFGSTQGLTFDGTSKVLSYSGVAVPRSNSASMSIVFKTASTVAGPQVILSQSDSAVTNDWWEVGIATDGKLYVESNAAGTKLTIEGSTVLSPLTAYNAILCFDGIDYYLLLNGVEENPLVITSTGAFAWLGRVAGTTVFSVGATVTSAGTARYFNGTIGGVWFWNQDITE